MSKIYTSFFEVMVDTSLYLAQNERITPPMGLYGAVAKQRWPWIVTNWTSLYPRFKTSSAGDENQESSLEDFDSAVSSYNLGNVQNALNNDSNYSKFIPFLMQIELSELSLIPEELVLIALENERVSGFEIVDFRNMRNFVRTLIATVSDSLGHGDDIGSVLFGGQKTSAASSGTFEDFIQIDELIDAEQLIEGIIFGMKLNEDRPPNLLAFANRNISPGGNIQVESAYQSYKSIPFYGSLEEMAAQFLGSVKRWYELVTVNNLQPPYIDDVGEKFSLLTPGGVNTVTIEGTNKAYIQVGQRVKAGSLKFREDTRIIERKVENDDGSVTLFLSGAQNLNTLRPKENAYVRLYKPGTMTTGSMMLIPVDIRTDLPTPFTPNSDKLRRLDRDLLAFGIDIARNETTGDLIVDSNGDLKLSVGLENIRQAIYWLFRTPLSQLPFHLNYGMNLGIGLAFYGSEDELTVISEVIKKNILRDPRFTQCEVTRIVSVGNGMSLDLQIGVGESGTLLPLAFSR